tara:strand:- start:1014 stop:2297 length:1284 start_codon:yes stop_codon:yes gene_type:complete
MKLKFELYLLFIFSLCIFITNCDDSQDDATITYETRVEDGLLGTWLVTSATQKVNIQPVNDVTIIDFEKEGTGEITVSGAQVNGSLKYITTMYSLNDSVDVFEVSNYPAGTGYGEEDYISYSNQINNNSNRSSSYIEWGTNEDYIFEWDTLSGTFSPTSFSVAAADTLEEFYVYTDWYGDDYSSYGEFSFYLTQSEIITISLTVDSDYQEATWNLYNTYTGSYYFEEDQEFTEEYEDIEVEIALSSGSYYLECYDSYGDGGISGEIYIDQTIYVGGSLNAATKSIASGAVGNVYNLSSENSIQTFTFNSDGTVIISDDEDETEDDEIDLWYMENDSVLVLVDSDYADGDEGLQSNIMVRFTMIDNGNGKIIKSSMEWCEYREYNEEDCDLTYNMLENQLMLDEGNLETVYQQLEFNLIPIGVSFIGN